MPPHNPLLCVAPPSWARPTERSPLRSGSFAPIPQTSHSTCASAISVFPERLPQTRAASKSPPRGASRDRGSSAALALHSPPVLSSYRCLLLGTRPAFCPSRIQCPQTRAHAPNHRSPELQLPAKSPNIDALSI